MSACHGGGSGSGRSGVNNQENQKKDRLGDTPLVLSRIAYGT